MKYRIWIFFIGLVIFGCTQKDNIVGSEELDNPEPIEINIDHTYFDTFVSYEDSVRNSNFNVLTIGQYDRNDFNTTAFSLLKFTSLPDTFAILQNSRLSLKISQEFQFDENELKLGKIISSDWDEYEADFFKPKSDSTWIGNEFDETDFENIENINIQKIEDSLSIEFPDQVVKDWILSNSSNFGFVLRIDAEEEFLEIFSSENSEDPPQLFFEYQETDADTFIEFVSEPNSDVSIFSTENNDFTHFQERIIISNMQPIRSYLKFNLAESVFLDAIPSEIDTTNFMQRISISNAELVLSSNENNFLPLDEILTIYPYLVNVDSLDLNNTTAPLIAADELLNPASNISNGSLGTDEFKINITTIVQAFTSGEYENNGIMLRSTEENKNFVHDEYSTDNIRLEITFVPPFEENEGRK